MKWLKNKIQITSIRFILSMSFAVLVAISMLYVGLVSNFQFKRAFTESVQESNDVIMNQVKLNLDNYFYSMIELSDLIAIKMTSSQDFSPESLDQVIEPTIRTRKDVITIALFDDNGEMLVSTDGKDIKSIETIQEQDWFQKIKSEKQYIYISEPHVQSLYYNTYPWVISVSRRVGYRQSGEYREGILLIDMNFSMIEKLLASVNQSIKGYVFLINDKEEVVFHGQQQLIYAGIKQEDLSGIEAHYSGTFLQDSSKRYLNIKVLDNANWKLVGAYHVSDIETSQTRFSGYVRWVVLIGLLVFATVSFYMSSRITKPIQELQNSMKDVEKGNFDIQLDISGEHEVVELTKSYNVMIRRIRHLMDQIIFEQEAKRKSELSSLQAQINPHFLYNTLDSIIWMAEHEKHDDVIKMTNALASLFRISISKGQMVIPVEMEIKHAQHYLTIQKMRYKDKFTFRFDIDESIYHFETLKLILQPIIENAIYHGIRHMVDEGEIIIRGYQNEKHLIFEVEDDGLGMDESTIHNVLYEDASANGVGISNVNDRIRLMYGHDYGLTIKSEIEEGTKITYRLPKCEVHHEEC